VSDTCNAEITVGGRIRACCVPALLRVLRDSDLAYEYNDTLETLEDLRDVLAKEAAFYAQHRLTPAGVTFGNSQTEGGNLDEAEAFCQRRGLPYRQHWDAGGEWGPGQRYWFPGDAGPQDVAATNDNEVVVHLEHIRQEWAGRTVDELLAAYDAIARPVPPLEVVPAEAACRGCLADALLPGASLPEDFPAAGAAGGPEAA
jgi:hypothetical protein